MNPESKPLIYLLNTPSTVQIKLSPSFNTSHHWMNGYGTYKASSITSLSIPYTHNIPSNLHEAEIVVFDTGLREGLIDARDSGVNIIYRHTPSYVDLLPLDMNAALKNIFSTNNTQLLVLFCESFNDETYILQNEAGRQSQYETNTYSFPNRFALSLQSRTGNRMRIVPGETAIDVKKCLEKYLTGSSYNFVFRIYKGEGLHDIPLLENEAGEVVSFVKFMGDKIAIFLPEVDKKADLLFELFDQVLPDLNGFSDIFPNHGSFGWVKDFAYVSVDERNKALAIEEEIKRHDSALASLKDEYENIHNKKENVKLRNMLKETGDDLVSSVKWFLEYIGFTDVVDPDKDVNVDAGEVLEEDLNFEHNGIYFLFEVKGLGGTSTDAQCAQISKIALRRKRANPGNTYKAVYIVNHRRYKAPKEREVIEVVY